MNHTYTLTSGRIQATSDLKLYCAEKTTSLVSSSPVILGRQSRFDENENYGSWIQALKRHQWSPSEISNRNPAGSMDFQHL